MEEASVVARSFDDPEIEFFERLAENYFCKLTPNECLEHWSRAEETRHTRSEKLKSDMHVPELLEYHLYVQFDRVPKGNVLSLPLAVLLL